MGIFEPCSSDVADRSAHWIPSLAAMRICSMRSWSRITRGNLRRSMGCVSRIGSYDEAAPERSALGRDHLSAARPVERRAGVGLTSRGDVAVARDAVSGECRVSRQKRSHQSGQAFVLDIRVGCVVGYLELDADGEVVAAAAALVFGVAGMPGAHAEGNVLRDGAVAADDSMGRDAERRGLTEGRMRVGAQIAREKMID